MINIKKNNFKFILKSLSALLIVSIVFFLLKETYLNFKNKSDIRKIQKQIEEKKKSSDELLSKTIQLKEDVIKIKDLYPSTKEIDEKLRKVFTRMSLLDYQLFLMELKSLCIDRHIIVARIDHTTDAGLKAGLGILNYLGPVQQSDKNPTIFFVDYISEKKDTK